MESFIEKARTVNECLHAYGIHSATLQPETVVSEQDSNLSGMGPDGVSSSLRRRRLDPPAACQILCSNLCHNLMCCTKLDH